MLLTANGHVWPDGSGKYKRKGSIEGGATLLPPSEEDDREALIYVHKVKPGDTMAGVMIKYNCQAQVFRRANRLWPNDSVQSRQLVVLPIEACGVRGRKLSEIELAAQVMDDQTSLDIMSTPRMPSPRPSSGRSADPEAKQILPASTHTSPSLSVSFSNPDEPFYRHDSWVMIDGFTEPVEIARLSRRALGYFPRNRRKSQSFSDLDTPATSLELPRGSYQSKLDSRSLRSRSNSNAKFASLHGPGGVGSMGQNVRSPGPANDGLNKLFPGMEQRVAPKDAYDFQTEGTVRLNGLDNFGGSIEGWVRKLANKASSSLQTPTPEGLASAGDLIELSEDPFDSAYRRRRDSPTLRGRTRGPTMEARDNAEDEDALHDSFLPRGRVFHDASKRQG